jgi:hypothetical protein
VTPAKQLDGFLAKYTPEMRAEAKAALRKMRAKLAGAVELVYDNWNGLVIGFGPTERASEAIMSLLLLPGHVTLCFLHGAKLRDPHKLLQGAGSRVRHIKLTCADDLDAQDIDDLIGLAIAKTEFPAKRRLIIKAISPKQRPRRTLTVSR